MVTAHSVPTDVRDEGQVELFAHETTEEATHGMRLPTSLGNDVRDADTGLPPKHMWITRSCLVCGGAAHRLEVTEEAF